MLNEDEKREAMREAEHSAIMLGVVMTLVIAGAVVAFCIAFYYGLMAAR